MKTNRILGIGGLLVGIVFSSCYKDLGNYDYKAINEVTIGETGFSDTTYVLKSFIDTLRIEPQVDNSIIQESGNYEFRWVVVGDQFGLGGTWEIGHEKNLVYPVNLPEQNYVIYFHVKDKTTNVVTTRSTGLSLNTVFSKGWLLLGENENGEVQLDMLSFVGNDTVLMKDVLKESGLPVLRKPTCLFVPPVGLTESSVQLGTESGTYKLDPAKLIPIENSHLKYSFWDISSAGNCVLQNANQLMMYRVEVIDGNLYYDRDRIVGQYNKIGNPSNHYKGEYELFRIGNKMGYNLQLSARMMSAIVCYDDDNKRFVYQGGYNSASGPDGYCEPIPALPGIDTWNPGLDFVTTINSRNVQVSNYTILKRSGASSPADYYLFGYKYAGNFNLSFSMIYNRQQMTQATEIDKAEYYASSMNKSYIFYTVGSRLYGYDCSKGKGKLLLDFAGKDMIGEDGQQTTEVITAIWNEQYLMYATPEDEFYIALYDPEKPASLGGRIVGYRIQDNSDDIVIEEIPASSREGICKVKCIAYKES